MNRNDKEIWQRFYLKEIANEILPSLHKDVAQDILHNTNHKERIADYFEKLREYGSINMVSDFHFYGTVHAFYDKHYNEIEYLRSENPIWLEILKNQSLDLKQVCACEAFNYTANELEDKMEMEWTIELARRKNLVEDSLDESVRLRQNKATVKRLKEIRESKQQKNKKYGMDNERT